MSVLGKASPNGTTPTSSEEKVTFFYIRVVQTPAQGKTNFQVSNRSIKEQFYAQKIQFLVAQKDALRSQKMPLWRIFLLMAHKNLS